MRLKSFLKSLVSFCKIKGFNFILFLFTNPKLKLCKLLGFTVLFLFSVYLVPSYDGFEADLLQTSKTNFMYANIKFDEDDNGLVMIVSQLLGSALNLDWYDACISTKYDVINPGIDNENISVGIYIIPVASNLLLSDYKELVRKLAFLNESVSKEEREKIAESFSHVLVANSVGKSISLRKDQFLRYDLFVQPDGSEKCRLMSMEEKGFLYPGHIYLRKGNDFMNEIQIDVDKKDPVGLVKPRLEIRANMWALIAKRFVVFIFLVGLCASIGGLLGFLFGDRKNK